MKSFPELTFPEIEATHLRNVYHKAAVILEYGSGGSTVLAASFPGKFVMSVESDREWAESLQELIDEASLPSPANVWHIDIGPTGEWGRPVDEVNWRLFYRYATKIWLEPFFCDPDVILIDGRFRAATFIAAILRIRKPATILFDDYKNRPAYHVVERVIRPVAIHGRMAEFHVEPKSYPIWVHDLYGELVGHGAIGRGERYKYAPIKDIWPDLTLSDPS